MKNLAVIAGETSGDLHCSGVIKELKKMNPKLSIFGVGGNLMQSAGVELLYNCNDISVMGFLEVIKHLPRLLKVEKNLKKEIRLRNPEKILLVDYPGFNLRIAKFARKIGIKVLYYISPQIWAWKKGRIAKIKNSVDKMFVVFPFEKKIYENENIDVEFVGHPLLEEIKIKTSKSVFKKKNNLNAKKIVALLPGSRLQEIEKIFPIMLKAIEKLKKTHDVDVLVPIAGNRKKEDFKKYLRKNSEIIFIENQTYEAVKFADVAIVTSGTATLETALLGTPFAVVYKTSWLTYFISKIFIQIKNIGLVNIVADREIVPEFIQNRLKSKNLLRFIKNVLDDKNYKEIITNELKQMRSLLGTVGASKKVAKGILN